MNLHSSNRFLALAVLTALATARAHAGEAASDEVIVEGTRLKGVPEDAPAVVAAVTREQIQATVNLFDVEDAIKYLPSIDVRKRYVGDRSSPVGSRVSGGIGFSARGLVYADGLLLANLLGNDNNDYTPRWGMVAPEEVSRIDVLYGPYSARYAGNAMGAVIAMTTRMPVDFEAHVKAQTFSQDFQAYKTSERFDGRQYSGIVGDRLGAFSIWVSANHLQSIGQPIAFASVTSTPATGVGALTGAVDETDQYGARRFIVGATSIDDTTQDTAKLKAAWEFGPGLQLQYTFGYWQNASEIGYESYLHDAAGNTMLSGTVDVGGGKRVTSAATNFGLQHQEMQHTLHGLELADTDGGAIDWRLTASAYDYGKDQRRKQNAYNAAAGTLTSLDGTNWRTLDGSLDWRPAGENGAHQAVFGFHADRYSLHNTVENVIDWRGSLGGSGTRNSAFAGETRTTALYAQDIWRFAESWQATAGLRYENWKARNGFVATGAKDQRFAGRGDRFLSPKLSVQWAPARDWTLRASWGRAFRMPTVAELFQGSIPNTLNVVNYNNPDLQPERVGSLELNAERVFRWGQAHGWVRGTLFHERNHGALIKQPVPSTDPNFTTATGTATFWSNVDLVRSRGAEVAWQVADAGLRGLEVTGSLTFAQSLIMEDVAQPTYVGNWQQRVPKWRARLVGSYRPSERWNLSLAGRYSGVQRNGYPNADIRPNTYLGFAPYLVFDAKATYKPSKQVSLAIGFDNLTNRLYYQFHPYPGRTVNAELRFDY